MTTPVACVVGWPVKHSRSPTIHRFWLKELALAGDYVLKPVEPDAIQAFLADFADSGFVGCNVTVPHKEAAFRAVAGMDEAARAIGALNTIWLEDGRLLGANTDAPGFLASLDQEAPGWDAAPGPAVVLGAGGAAKAIVYALRSRGFAPVTIVNRTEKRAEQIARNLGGPIEAARLTALPGLLGGARLLVNTTTLGMEGQPPLDLDLAPLADDAVVSDLVYVPLETGLLKAARARGLRAVGGLGMLLHQAVPGFEHWFGRRPTVTPALRAAVIETLGAAASADAGTDAA
ncbi:MAG: shikimate dehydrogenase [Bauldia sp.]|uniref:shikimate dehydrogenase n=1 Tax=Bauldia sp. TaxID=2575872 RepID=UPI001D489EBA|nr:shikimate dehydrogenase [Bauldia sp.]MCB1498162.1 shikimate dehydrogenase [Bauldia sp.]